MSGGDTAWDVLAAAIEGRDAGASEVKKCALAKNRFVALDLVLVEGIVPMPQHRGVLSGTIIALPSWQRQVPAVGPRRGDLRLRGKLDRRLLAFLGRPALQFAVLTFGGGWRGFLRGSFG